MQDLDEDDPPQCSSQSIKNPRTPHKHMADSGKYI